MRHLRLYTAALLALAGVWFSALAQGLPNLGDDFGYSLAQERRLGDRIAKDIFRDPDYSEDVLLDAYLSSLWQPLLAAARQRGDLPDAKDDFLAWRLLLNRDKRINAFALPGGYLGVNLGLIGVTEHRAELASVLAHELSHVSQRHIARLMAKKSQNQPWLLASLLIAAAAASRNADVANAAIAAGQAATAQQQLAFSRDMEREADRMGFGILQGANYPSEGFAAMFGKLQQSARLNDDGALPYLRSHPLTSERIADMKARQGLDGHKAALGPDTLHDLMAARARVQVENAPDRWREWTQIAARPQATAGERYQGLLAMARLGQGQQAADLAQQWRKSLAGNLNKVDHAAIESVLDALILELPLRPDVAEGAITAALRSPQRPLMLLATKALLSERTQAARPWQTAALASASERLTLWLSNHPNDALAWRYLSLTLFMQQQPLRALRAEAESRFAQYDHAGALDRLQAALDLPRSRQVNDQIELEVIQARRREITADFKIWQKETEQ